MYRLGMETAVHTDALARFGHALSDSTRTRILLSLRTGPGYPTELAEQIGVTRQILSNHLACLRGCGIVVATPEGRQTRYEIADPHLTRAIGELVKTVLAVDDGAPCADENCDVPLCCGPGAETVPDAAAEAAAELGREARDVLR